MLINDLGCFKMFANMVPFGHSPPVVAEGAQRGGIRTTAKGNNALCSF